MKPYFISCSIDQITYLRGDLVINKPLNSSLCLSAYKDKLAWYPDNKGLPAIKFLMMNDKEITWAYKSEEMRNEDYELIIKNQFLNVDLFK